MIIHIEENRNGKPEPSKNKCRQICSAICFLSVWKVIILLCTLIVIICLLLLCRAYLKFVLLWLEKQDSLVISATICVLFIVVSLPISIGYILLVLACGYLFNVCTGLILTIFGANFGLLVAHNVLKILGHHHSIFKYTQSDFARAMMSVISGPLCFKIVFCSRLTPIPFGLQNTIFALGNVSGPIYHLASLMGLFPGQLVGVYVGSKLRSMQDVLENKHLSSTAYVFGVIQILLGVCLMIWVGTKARRELLKALEEAGNTSDKSTSFSV